MILIHNVVVGRKTVYTLDTSTSSWTASNVTNWDQLSLVKCDTRGMRSRIRGAGHFGHKTFRHHKIGAEVSGHFGTGSKVSVCPKCLVRIVLGPKCPDFSSIHFGTGAEVSRADPKCLVAEMSGNPDPRLCFAIYLQSGPEMISHKSLAALWHINNNQLLNTKFHGLM